jgi:hypothetical protein
MCDGFTLADLCFVIDGNLGNLYCYPRPAPINNCNLRVSFLGQKSPHKISIVNYLDTVWLGGVAENCYRHGAVMFDSISLCLKHGNKKRKQAVHMMMSGCAHLWIKLFITGIGIQPFLPGGKDFARDYLVSGEEISSKCRSTRCASLAYQDFGQRSQCYTTTRCCCGLFFSRDRRIRGRYQEYLIIVFELESPSFLKGALCAINPKAIRISRLRGPSSLERCGDQRQDFCFVSN